MNIEFAVVDSFDSRRGFGLALTEDGEPIYIGERDCHDLLGEAGKIYFANSCPSDPPESGAWIVFERSKCSPTPNQNWAAALWGDYDQYRQAYLDLEQGRPKIYRVIAHHHQNDGRPTSAPPVIVAQGALIQLKAKFPRREDEADPCGEVYVRQVGELHISCRNTWEVERSEQGGRITWLQCDDPRPLPIVEAEEVQSPADNKVVPFKPSGSDDAGDAELVALAATAGGNNTKANRAIAAQAGTYGDHQQRQGDRHHRRNRF